MTAPNPKFDQMTGKHRNDFATVGMMQDVTDTKIGGIINAYIVPLRARVAELEKRQPGWWERWLRRWR